MIEALLQQRRVVRFWSIPSGAIETLKWLALLAMVLDHVNAVFFARELGTWATAAGRLAFPLFAIVLGYNLARPGADYSRAAGLLLWFGLVALPAHAFLFGMLFGWWPLNVLFTFAVAVAVLAALDADRPGLATLLFVAGGAFVEYWWTGVSLVVFCALFFREPRLLHGLWVVAALAWLCAVNGNGWALVAVPLVLLVARAGPHCPRSPRLFWWFYPLHLVVLAAIAWWWA